VQAAFHFAVVSERGKVSSDT